MNHRIAACARRQFLQAGTLGLFGGLAAARSLSADIGSGSKPGTDIHAALNPKPAKNCILVYLLGGPPHLDMWDPKPAAPAETRGPFETIGTAVPGTFFSEHLPRMAGQAKRLAVLRSFSYPNSDHPFMIYHTLTGRVSPTPLGANTVLPPSPSDDPHMGSVVARFKHASPHVPAYVAIPEVCVRMSPLPVSGGGRAGFLGPRYEPLAINDDPRQPLPLLNLPDGISSERFGHRNNLLAILDGRSPRSFKADAYGVTRESAVQLTGAAAGGGLFDLASEPPSLCESYGRHRFGQSLLLARRLVERGVSFVGVHFNYMSKCDGWDLHSNNHASLKDELLPMLDQGLSSLLDDLAQRGMLDETLVVTMGEFGRTPKINANAGRDHWGPCGSIMFAGGGVRAGTVIGASDKTGAYPTTSPVSPADVVASIYHGLGLDPETLMHDNLGRPLPLSTGRAIEGLF
ncbi:MAG: DUF1501 domain-containing protein [Planctomycetaceae bacterium]